MAETNDTTAGAATTDDSDSGTLIREDMKEINSYMVTVILTILSAMKLTFYIILAFFAHAMFTGNYDLYFNRIFKESKIMFPLFIIMLFLAFMVYTMTLMAEERDAIVCLLRLLYSVRTIQTRLWSNKQNYSVADGFEERVDQNGEFVQIITVENGLNHTLNSLEKTANIVAQWGISEQLQTTGSTVGLLMLNRPEHVSIWIGLAKIGCSTAMLNTNISGSSLIHCVEISLKKSEKKIVIVDDDIFGKSMTKEDKNAIKALGVQLLPWSNLLKASKRLGHERPPRKMRANMGPKDTLMYIFTSGTTGKPKASRINHLRYETGCLPYQKVCNLDKNIDRVYCALPLYHSSAAMMGLGTCMKHGITMVLRKKFSVNRFAEDCFTFKCTSFQYIGELCRFLISIPPGEFDSHLSLRTAYGNGLSADVWETFRKRYGIKRICEFYAATEGNVAMFNPTGTIGRLGYIPPLFKGFYNVKIVKMDPDDPSNPLRIKSTGYLLECMHDEPGLVIARISAAQEFEGYSERKDTDKKKLYNCFRKGDSYYNTGDSMSRTIDGYYTWEDRVGDTFRWKGENVATTEVTACIASGSKSIADCAVYGVAINGYDGKAGMAAIQPSANGTTIDFEEVAAAMKKDLPVYACPVFFRVVNTIPLTSTFKHKKTQLANEGWKNGDDGVGKDEVYLYDPKSCKFSLLTSQLEDDINSKKIRL